jgi:hypothetical protein
MADDITPSTPKSAGSAIDESTLGVLHLLYVSAAYGVESFALMLETYHGLTADHRRKLDACRRLAATRARLISDHVSQDLAIEVKPPTRTRQAAESLATLQHGSWSDRMSELEIASIRGVQGFRTLKSIYGARQPRLCAVLLAHEMALRDFARDEMDGETGESLYRILALLDPEDRAAIATLDVGDDDPRR